MAPSRRGGNHAKMVCLVGEDWKNVKRKMEELDQQKVNQMIKGAEGSAGRLQTNTRGAADATVGNGHWKQTQDVDL